ncbi:DUF4276 family protein [Pseudomonas sp.]|uniref:DUF4276 family protein n=1 Tax=Pseudomonas sp. TaxID=306 RepID=UPI0028A6C4E2|nr:DUF4276 family protein [Pseudomonas sp.]
MATKIGIIAEDESDVDVIKEILGIYIPANNFGTKKFVGKGCGKLRAKCAAWTTNLVAMGCEHILIFHDLDRYDEHTLRKELSAKIELTGFKNTLIVIPVEELESWLLSDMEAIKEIFSIQKKIKPLGPSEKIKSPKEQLQKLVKRYSKKTYINTIHNKKIASKLRIQELMNCKSFHPLNQYLNSQFKRHEPPHCNP